MIKLETERLIIRDHIEEDINSLHSLISNDEAMYYLPEIKTHTLDESMENLYEAIKEANLENRAKFFFGIIIKATNEYVGEIGYTITINSLKGKVVNLGYFILPKFWGKGFVTEAAREVISYAFSQEDIIKIETGCVTENVGSEKVMKKLGMIKEAEFKQHVLLNFQLLDRVEYRLLKEEWFK
ncbi:GNAT family N-acetyltransferase [Clostridium sp. 'White wine YQ']|uniref:GNAT family N-acetyltransferase n=1 Tax=Clostridium sp. 'White wine YQ' TaxID=3027474 RepID=UPI00236719A8|nr:GNAT family protein [Clostridium sp. 'White wine YQ']MDD7793298.1 GNAT family protein [Clostridium sp. 'White wine YQ']